MSRRLAVVAGVVALLAAVTPAASADQGSAVLGAVRDDGGRLGQVVVVAGTGRDGYSGDGWSARDARISDVTLSVGPDGTLYLADRAQGRVRAVTTDGIIDTVPGTAVLQRPRQDDPAYEEWHANPTDRPTATTVGADGSLYIAGSETVIRRLPDGTIVRIAGGGTLAPTEGASATAVDFINPTDLAVDAAGTVYLADLYDSRVLRIDASGTITTVAGGGTLLPSVADGRQATEVNLADVSSLAVDSVGNLYFATNNVDPEDVRVVGKVAPDGTYTTVVADAQFSGITVDGDDNLYVNDLTNGLIRQVTPEGDSTTVGPVRGGADIAVGPDGDIYSAGSARVYRLVRHGEPPAQDRPPRGESRWAGRAPGAVETVFGTGAPPAGDAPVVDHDSPGPDQVTIAQDGTVYYVDTSRHQVGSVAPDGTATVLPGSWKDPTSIAAGPDGGVYVTDGRVYRIDPGGDSDSVATPALEEPRGVAVDAAGAMYVTDSAAGDALVHRIGADGTASVVAGAGDRWAEDAENQPAATAALAELTAITVDRTGVLYFIDPYNSAVWRVGSDGVLRTAVGTPFSGFADDSFGGDGGPATRADVNNPQGLATGPDGSLYLADTHNNRIRRITPDGVISTFAGTGEPAEKGDGGPAVDAALLEPTGIAVHDDGTVYVTSPIGGTIRRIDPAGTITTLIRFAASPHEGRRATEVPVENITGITVDGAGRPSVVVNQNQLHSVDEAGRLHVESVSGSHVVTGPDGSTYVAGLWAVDRHYPDGTVVPVMGYGPVTPSDGRPAVSAGMPVTDLATGPDGELYVAGETTVFRIDADGLLDLVVEQAVSGIAVGPDGSLYVADSGDNRVLRVRDGETTPFAGTGASSGADDGTGDGGPATEAVVWSPSDVAVAVDGTVFVSSPDGIRRIATDGTIETIVHPAGESNGDGPDQLALDAHGNLYFTEPQLFRVRVVVAAGEFVVPAFDWDTMWFGVTVAVAAFVLVEVRRRRLLEEVVGQPE
jgi:streptogramin lyase